MKTRVQAIACIGSLAVLMALAVFACGPSADFIPATESPSPPEPEAPTNELIGVWKVTEAKLPANPEQNLEARTITNPQPGLLIFTKKYYSLQMVAPEKPRFDLPSEGGTEAQWLEVMAQFTSNGGTYEVKGEVIAISPTVAKLPFIMKLEAPQNHKFKFERDILILTQPFNQYELKFTRLE